MEKEAISNRAIANTSSVMYLGEGFRRWNMNPYNATTNPSGCINLGTAENKLHQNEILERINGIPLQLTPKNLGYGDVSGTVELRTIIAGILNRHWHPKPEISPEEVVMVCGTGAAISAIGQVVCDVNDGILIPAPYYGGFDPDLHNQAQVKTIGIHLDPNANFAWDLNIAQRTLDKARSQGINVKAFLLCSPNNPFGTCYTREELLGMLDWCAKEGLHLISDEIYGLSTFDSEFISIYSLPIPKEMEGKVHILWGMSKDFCMNGLRIGFVISRNQRVVQALKSIGFFHNVNSLTDSILQKYLGDEAWVDLFISNNKTTLKIMYDKTAERLKAMGVPFLPATGGYFVWMDLRRWLKPGEKVNYHGDEEVDYTTEMEMWEKLLDAGLYIALGRAFNCRDPGWFRMLFAPENWTVMSMCLDRLEKVLK